MKPFRTSIAILFCLSATLLTGCYDGWDYSNGNGTNNPTTTTTTTSGSKSIYYILYEPIYLDASAVADSTCFGSTSTGTFRAAEWSERTSANVLALNSIAETVVVRTQSIPQSDCTALDTVETTSKDPISTITSTGNVKDDPLNRPIVHLKAVFFDGDVGGTFSSNVKSKHWAAWRVFLSRGRPAVSLHYFSLSNSTTGHFSDWRSSISSSNRQDATTISEIDPTDTGIRKRKDTAATDANRLATFVVNESLREKP